MPLLIWCRHAPSKFFSTVATSLHSSPSHPRHSSIFLTDEEMNGEGEEDELPELPAVMESYQDEEVIAERREEGEQGGQKDEL